MSAFNKTIKISTLTLSTVAVAAVIVLFASGSLVSIEQALAYRPLMPVGHGFGFHGHYPYYNHGHYYRHYYHHRYF